MESRPAVEPELKRPLWIIGAEDYNLGMTVAKVASDDWYYRAIYTTDEQTGDVTSQEGLIKFLREAREYSPETGIDIAYCAGLNMLDAIEDVDEINLWSTFNVNVLGFIRLMKAIIQVYYREPYPLTLPTLTPQITTNVVAVASDAARVAMRRSITYCASKAALVQAVRVAARECAPYIRVNAVSPGIIEGTPMTTSIDAEVRVQRRWTEEQHLDYERSQIPMQRRATKFEVADLIIQTLLGPAYLTGSNIEITGGK